MSKQNLIQLAATRLSTPEDGSRAASKYDFVKVKVWLGDDMAHYYVLSRFLISRMLTVTKVPHQKAVKIALDVKKYFVDNDRLDIPQAELETILFSVMRSKGFGDEFVDLYRMVNQFFQQKRPLIILICGSACTGKSTFAQQLASRLNLPNVLQTDILYELLRTSEYGPLSSTPLWSREGLADEELISEFQKECRIIRRGLEGDLCKCIKDGKPIIIEGLHLDPGLYLDEFGRHGMIGMGGTAGLELPSGLAMEATLDLIPHSRNESVAVSPPTPSSPLSISSDSNCGGSGSGSASPYTATPLRWAENSMPSSSSHHLPHRYPGGGSIDDDIVLARRSVSFGDATPALSYTSAYSRQSPWRHLRPGGFLHRLLSRPGSAREAQLPLPLHSPVPLSPPAPCPSPPQHGVLRTASVGHVTFMLQQADGSALAPTPVMPGTEVVIPASSPLAAPSPLREWQDTLEADSPQPPDVAASNAHANAAWEPAGGAADAGVGLPPNHHHHHHHHHQQQHQGEEPPPSLGGQAATGLPAAACCEDPGASATFLPASGSAGRGEEGSSTSAGAAELSAGGCGTWHPAADIPQWEASMASAAAGPRPPTMAMPLDCSSDAHISCVASNGHGEQEGQRQQQQQPCALEAPPEQHAHPGASSSCTLLSSEACAAPAAPPGLPEASGSGSPQPLSGMAGAGPSGAAQAWGAAVGDARLAAAAASAAGGAAEAAPCPHDSQGPVFVPLVLSMDPQDYELVVQEWQAAVAAGMEGPPGNISSGGGGDGCGGGTGGGEEGADSARVLRRLQVLQGYLCAYGAVGVPVVEVNVGSFHETLDKLHDYLLQCIRMSL